MKDDLESTPGPKARITLSPAATRYVHPDLLENQYALRDRHAADLAKARSVSPELLPDWAPQINSLVGMFSHSLGTANTRLDKLGPQVAVLEERVETFSAATATYAKARAAHDAGSLDRNEQMALAADLDCGAAAHRIAGRRLEAQVAICKQGLPALDNGGGGANGSRAIADAILDDVQGKRWGHKHGRPLDADALRRLYATSEADLRWTPLWATVNINAAKAEKTPKDSANYEYVRLDVAAYVSALGDFKRARAAHLQAVATKAKSALHAAQAAVADTASAADTAAP